ncbi:MAG TPA: serine hydrolase domain-containing protein [Euzebyales bacterium]|nr:serine hydrolase domain-containing protein [Euzebyales bacterium]
MTVAISDPDTGARFIVSGRDAEEPVAADARFRVGSITKTFVATVVMQLADEHRLRLDDPLLRYVPASPWGDVSLRQLLRHTGGVPDHTLAAGFADALLDKPERRWTTAEVLDLVADRDRDFAPGTAYAYSNTGYVLLGQVIQAVTGQPWARVVRQRIIEPLGLGDTSIAGVDDPATDTISGWFDTSGDGFDDPVTGPWPALDTTEGPAGALVSTAPDLVRFARALFEGDLVSRDARREMTTPGQFHPPHSNYGAGRRTAPTRLPHRRAGPQRITARLSRHHVVPTRPASRDRRPGQRLPREHGRPRAAAPGPMRWCTSERHPYLSHAMRNTG